MQAIQLAIRALLARAMLCAATVAFACGAAAAPLSCYRGAGLPAPPARAVTIGLIDKTTTAEPQAVDSFRALIARAISGEGERVVLVSFAGFAPGQYPAVIADVMQEPAPDAAVVRTLTMKRTRQLESCLAALRQRNAATVDAALHDAVGKEMSAPYSEIAAALRWAMVELAPQLAPQPVPVRVAAFSDGDENSRSGLSFYRHGSPREIDAGNELRDIVAERATLPDKPRPVDLYWVGLGLQPGNSKVYMTPRAIEERRKFWTGLARLYGARHVYIGTTLTDDVFGR